MMNAKLFVFSIFLLCSVMDHCTSTSSRILCCDTAELVIEELSDRLDQYKGELTVDACKQDQRLCAKLTLLGDFEHWDDGELSEGCGWDDKEWSCKWSDDDEEPIHKYDGNK